MIQNKENEMNKGGAFLTTPFGVDEIFTREKWSDDQKEFFETIQSYSAEAVAPMALELEKLDEKMSRDFMTQMGEMGILGMDVPEQYGGMGLAKTDAALALEATGASESSSLMVTVTDHTGIGLLPILWYGNDEQREKYIPKMMSGEWMSSFALTEPGAGSDALNGTAAAKLNAEETHYILNGVKQFVTNGAWADISVVFAKVDGGKLTAFILDKDTTGWERGPEEHKLGIKGSSTTTFILKDCKVPVENVIGSVGKGAAVAFNCLYIGRLKLGAVTMGGAKESIRAALEYAKERHQFAQPLTAFGMMQRKFADMVIRSYEADTITYQSTGSIDSGTEKFPSDDPEFYNHLYTVIEDHAIENSTNKIFSSEALWINADDGLQILGGYGVSEEYPFARILRDERVNRIFEGTNEINKMIISGIVMKKAILEELPIREQILEMGEAWLPSVEIPADHPQFQEIKAVELGRGIVLKTLNELILKHGQDFKNTQFEIEAFANMVIAQQIIFSVLRRYLQLDAAYPRRDVVCSVLKISVLRNLEVIVSNAKKILRHILSDENRKIKLSKLDEALSDLDYHADVIEEQKVVFQLLLKRGSYPLND
ncbi:MAG: acyl-CoA dehydrogenase [Candidatus Marinimicrobia bacterium]|nr:acyl-CoA dehydrogenase [Candidatus Neomarinimicrobiota bacterium]MBT3632631.1 acyl-CoA dehydrogenase [Candidatus Neomarinimicrobiota bacterium]MBT4294754.1 acyl-CoA dehydrogenase [Candidatus Neomarinimicrobiota bacterium]MBT4993108.1 acyl-CoA dehydrogenase [Candidatus Neomarinimicrobiota bacterium]MBT5313885.1 acyl-CoA dehydrogenase [Candidatus Neomarinimicrobiota bacterium]